MSQPAFDHAAIYGGMSDGELLAIAKDSESLTATALAALQEELKKRQLEQTSPEEDHLAFDNRCNWRDQLVSKLNSPQMMVLLPRWNGAQAEEDLRILLQDQPIGGWVAVFASQMIIGGLISLFAIPRLLPLDANYTHVSHCLMAWMPVVVALDLLYISTGVALWKKWRFAVKLASAAFAAGALNSVIFLTVLLLIGFVYRPPASALSHTGPWLAPDVKFVLARATQFCAVGVLFGVVGLLYLARSRRVRLTYAEEPARSQNPR